MSVELLGLIAAGASAQELAAAGADPRATEAALRIHATLAGHTRREAELAALFDTASDLARLRDTDAVLQSIVHRARMLLRVDVSYLSMNRPGAGGTYMRVTDGCTSALFKALRLGMGEGLGGLVAQTARPYATADYPTDPRFRHTGPIDEAVRDEGLIAIIGVPLALGDEVIGVLYASDRRPRQFSPAEVALLSSLADHAAIAIDNARLIETIQEHHATIARAQEAHDRLTALVLGGSGVREVAEAVAGVLGGAITVHDATGTELGRSGVPARYPSAEVVAASQTSGRAVAEDGVWTCAALAGPELLGSITLTGRADLVDADRRLFERASVVTALLLLLRRSTAEAEDRVRGELVADLLTAPDRDPGALIDRARRVGVDLGAGHVVLVLQSDACSRGRLAAAVAGHAALAGLHAEQVVALVPPKEAAADPGKLASMLAGPAGGPVTVAAAGPAAGPAGLAAAHAEAARCLRAMLALGREGDGATAGELGFVGVLLGDRADTAGFVRSVLGPVLDYDARRGTELVKTLDRYFAAGGNLVRAKDSLHVHVNTVAQRLERISALLGPDWSSPAGALELQLALRLHRLTRSP
ncbi:GAF domain-containing protein [Saccharothrix sp. AJ9571]|nr:GAF domain-containing protein [Saccharothrix sp. AJ9571]